MCQLPLLVSTKESGMSQGNTPSGPIYGRRIVFYGAAEDVNEPTLLQLFSKYGDVSGLFLVRSALGLPSGCGYATMATAEQASAAVEALQGSSECAEAGGRLGLLVVQSAAHTGNEQQEDSSTSPKTKESRTVFFTKVPPTVTAHQLIQLFTACGEVVRVELFTPWPGAKISKGCGLVEFAQVGAAAAAVNSLHQAFTWPHSHSPLVVEWLDSKRQAANRASKLSKQNSCDGTAAPIRRTLTVPMDRAAAMAAGLQGSTAMYGSSTPGFVGVPGQMGMQQQQSSNSCPLPRMQMAAAGGWMQPAAWSAPGYALLPTAPLPQVQEQAGYCSQLQQQGDYAALSMMPGGQWVLPQHVSSGMNSVASTYDNSSSLSMTVASTLSNASIGLQMSAADISTGTLACCSASNAMAFTTGAEDLVPYSGCQSPIATSDSSLAATATAALGAGRMNAAWQQLQQQNVMLLQPMGNPVDNLTNNASRPVCLPGTKAAFVAERQAQPLQLSNAAATGIYTSIPAASAGKTLQQQQQQQQYQQQLVYVQPGGIYSSGTLPLQQQQQQQQQQWWSLQQQQQQPVQVAEESMLAVPLSARQLQAMSAVVSEVPRLTGAKAILSACAVGSGVQLVLSGPAAAVKSAHSATAILLSNMGIDEPLMSAVMMQHS